MKRALLGTTAVIGGGLMATSALAESPIQLSVGGFFREAYQLVLDDDESGPENSLEPGDEHSDDGFFNDAEIHFMGRTVLDNGLEIGARVELEGEDDEDQIDEAWVYFAGGFGEFRVGADDEALSNSCILPPGGTANFSAFSPNQWGANAFDVINPAGNISPFGTVTNSACEGVDDKSDAQKIIYFSPIFHGFQLTASYTPNPDAETHVDGVGPHTGMPVRGNDDADFDASFYLTYFYAGHNWDITLGAGGSFEASVTDGRVFFFGPPPASSSGVDNEEQDFYQTAFVLNVDRFSIGGVFEYFNDLDTFEVDEPFSAFSDTRFSRDAWVAGGGGAYNYNAWTFGAQYSYRKDIFKVTETPFGFKKEQVQQRAVATINYALGPGINLDGEFAYTWRDQDPENLSPTFNNDDYSAMEFGIGTAVTF